MSDNVAITAGSGTNIAADDVSSVYFQKVKIDAGGDGATTPILAGGGVEASALRVTIASDSTGVLSVDDNGSTISIDDGGGAITVDGNVSVVTALDSAVAILGTSTYTEGAVVGLTIGVVRRDADTTLVDTTNEVGPLQMDANGRLKVEAFSGETLPVSLATVPALVAGTANIGDVDVASIAAGDNNIGNVDIVTMPAVTNGGTFAVQVDGAALTSLQLADDVVFAEDAAHTTADKGNFVLAVRNDTPNTALTNTDLDYSAIAVNRVGSVRLAPPEDDFAVVGSNHVKKYYTNAGAVTDGIVWSPAAGKRWYITSIFINVSAAATVTLEDDLAGGDSPVWKAELAANSGWSSTFPVPWFSGEDAADLIVTTSAGNVYITVVGYEI